MLEIQSFPCLRLLVSGSYRFAPIGIGQSDPLASLNTVLDEPMELFKDHLHHRHTGERVWVDGIALVPELFRIE